MHILIAPDSFKESLSAPEVAKALKSGFRQALPSATFDLLPLGDGGEGTIACLKEALGYDWQTVSVTGPFGQKVDMPYASKGRSAMFEMADLVGLARIPKEKRNLLTIETRGLGELLVYLAENGFKEVLVGVGGSSTNDGGIGLAAGLGYEFYDQNGKGLPAIGASLGLVNSWSSEKVPTSLEKVTLKVLVDVDNPLCGPNGATYVFSAQKGLAIEKQEQVDQDMRAFYQQVNEEMINFAGAGAGGGMAAGLLTFAKGEIISGIDMCLNLLDFDRRVVKADLVVVGEGRLDRQSLSGKTPIGVAKRTPEKIPVIAICGSLSDDLPSFPISQIKAAFPIISHVDSLENTLAFAEKNLVRTAQNIGNLLSIAKE